VRLFIAADIDDNAREQIAALQWRLKRRVDETSSVKWIRPEQMHLTLAFIGEANEMLSAKLIVAMQKRSAQGAFDATFERIGIFPPRGAPRVLWLGVTEGADEMVALQREFAARVEAVGVTLESRPFHPHLTLARWRDGRPRERHAFEEGADTGAVARVRIDHATLYRSQLSSSGSTYTPVARVTLFGSA
jgi:2'-5' RNA ligase